MKHAGRRESETQAAMVRGLRWLRGLRAMGKHGAYLIPVSELASPADYWIDDDGTLRPNLDSQVRSSSCPTDRMADWMKPAGVGKHAEVRDGS